MLKIDIERIGVKVGCSQKSPGGWLRPRRLTMMTDRLLGMTHR